MIFRTRRRPRVDSMSFRGLGWLVRMEALFHVYRTHYPRTDAREVRAQLMASCAPRAGEVLRGFLCGTRRRLPR